MSENEELKVEEVKKEEEKSEKSEKSENSENEEEQIFEKKEEEEEKAKDEKEEKKYTRPSVKRRKSLYEGYEEKQEFFRPEYQFNVKDPIKEKMWELMDAYLPRDKLSIQKSIVTHIEYTLARTRFEIDNNYMFQGTALSVRDRLLEQWNDTQMYIRINNPKKVYYLSIEFLLGRLLQNALVNLELEDRYRDALMDFGVKLEEIYESENDPALGNGGLGRLAACYIDSLATLNYPAWGYGIRYEYGIFKQVIENFEQKELPDYWLTKGNPWEIIKLDLQYKVRFYGYCKDEFRNGKKVRVWRGGQEVLAIAHDTAVPGFQTFNCNTLRLWKAYPSEEFNFDEFNRGQHQGALESKDQASYISAVLYPNDSTLSGKELRLKQEYFFSCASIQNIVNRFRRMQLPWSDFPKYNTVQLNDTHPTIALVELLRILIDEYEVEYKDAFDIVLKTFNYTNHTVLPEALEKWGVDIFERLLPRHLELIYLINFYFMEECKKKFHEDWDKIGRLSIIEESFPKQIRMANLCVVASSHVNGVAKIHSGLVKTMLFKDFADMWPNKFTNVTNGVTPRRWVHCEFPELSALLTEYNGGKNEWLAELDLLEEVLENVKKQGKMDEFIDKFKAAKLKAKLRLKEFVKKNCNLDIDETFMFDIMVKRIHEYKRQFMNCLYCIRRYLDIKKMSPGDREKLNKRVTFFGGKAAPGYALAKNVIKLINMVANTVNNDNDVNQYYKVVFLPDYKVSSAQIIIPAADINEQISTAGTEASGTSCMKFVMTGSLIIGTRDGANIEIADNIGEDHIFYFGKTVNEVEKIRKEIANGKRGYVGSRLQECFDAIFNNRFGNTKFMHDYINGLINGGDFYLACHDFYAYMEAQEKVDKAYQDSKSWYQKCVEAICKMGFFSSDRAIQTYANDIWNITPLEVPKPSITKSGHLVSTGDLKHLGD
jgi:starch phosphorylase